MPVNPLGYPGYGISDLYLIVDPVASWTPGPFANNSSAYALDYHHCLFHPCGVMRPTQLPGLDVFMRSMPMLPSLPKPCPRCKSPLTNTPQTDRAIKPNTGGTELKL